MAERDEADAPGRQLAPADRVALVSASTEARPLGTLDKDGAALAPVTPKRAEELLDALAHQAPAGATEARASRSRCG